MKVLFVSAGSSVHTVRWVNALVARGVEVHLAFCANHAPKTNMIDSGVVLHALPFASPLGYYFNAGALAKLSRQLFPDVINVHYASGYGTLARKAKLKDIILSVWGSDVYDFPFESKFALRTLRKNLAFAKYLASTSHVMARQTEQFLSEKRDISITPFGVDTTLFQPIAGLRDKNKILIGTVKSLSPKYGISDSINAFNQLLGDMNATRPDIADKLSYEIYGSGEQEQELKGLIATLGLENRVFLKGYVPNSDLPKIINTFDIFVATSRLESFGVSAVEAMSCAVAVVVSDADGFTEVVENGVTGIIVPKKDVSAISKALFKLALDERVRLTYGENGRKRVLSEYDWSDNVANMLRLYEFASK